MQERERNSKHGLKIKQKLDQYKCKSNLHINAAFDICGLKSLNSFCFHSRIQRNLYYRIKNQINSGEQKM